MTGPHHHLCVCHVVVCSNCWRWCRRRWRPRRMRAIRSPETRPSGTTHRGVEVGVEVGLARWFGSRSQMTPVNLTAIDVMDLLCSSPTSTKTWLTATRLVFFETSNSQTSRCLMPNPPGSSPTSTRTWSTARGSPPTFTRAWRPAPLRSAPRRSRRPWPGEH